MTYGQISGGKFQPLRGDRFGHERPGRVDGLEQGRNLRAQIGITGA